MEWFNLWWQGLGLVGQIMACAAIPMTIVMILQLILMILGIGFGSSDGDFDNDVIDHGGDHGLDHGGDHGLDNGGDNASDHGGTHDARFFTIRGVVAFFALGGWAGLAALTAGIRPLWSIHISLLSGVAAMLLASLAIKLALGMQSSGNIDLRNAISLTADVYIPIPPSRSNTGKVTLVLQERFIEVDALTDSDFTLRSNSKVEVVGVDGTDVLIVRPVDERLI